MPDTVYCFQLAATRSRVLNATISKEDWIWHVTKHLCGVRHPSPGRNDPNRMCFSGFTPVNDPFGNAVRKMALNDDYEPLNEEEFRLYEKLFLDTLHGDVEGVQAAFDSVSQLRSPHLNPLQAVAALGAFEGHMNIIHFALDRGVEVNSDFCIGVSYGRHRNSEVAKYWQDNEAAFDKIIHPLRYDPSYKPRIPYEQIRDIDESIGR